MPSPNAMEDLGTLWKQEKIGGYFIAKTSREDGEPCDDPTCVGRFAVRPSYFTDQVEGHLWCRMSNVDNPFKSWHHRIRANVHYLCQVDKNGIITALSYVPSEPGPQKPEGYNEYDDTRTSYAASIGENYT